MCRGSRHFGSIRPFFHDELEILDKDGNVPMDHRTGLPSSTTAISYRSEPMRNRMPLTHDIWDGSELCSGTKAVIRRRDGTSFREFTLFVHDFALLFDGKGKALNPPEVPGSHDDPGVMGINYRAEPMRERLRRHKNPTYVFSSLVHKDSAIPILETYPGDELMIRLLDGANEEQHAFNITGMSWRKEMADERSPAGSSKWLVIMHRLWKNHIAKQTKNVKLLATRCGIEFWDRG